VKMLILCGGLGTRLAGASELPKPMVPIGERPMLWHIMRGLAHHGFNDFVLCLGHRSDYFKHYFMHLPTMLSDVRVDTATGAVTALTPDQTDWHVTLAETGADSATGYRVKMAGHYVRADGDDIFGVTYGDGVTDLDFRKVVAFHRSHGRLATVTAVHPPGRFGELSLGAEGRVVGFNEKPQVEAGWISGGFFVFSSRVHDRLSDDSQLILEREPLQSLAREGELMAYPHEGFWYCMDTPRDYQQLTTLWSSGRAPWAVWKQ